MKIWRQFWVEYVLGWTVHDRSNVIRPRTFSSGIHTLPSIFSCSNIWIPILVQQPLSQRSSQLLTEIRDKNDDKNYTEIMFPYCDCVLARLTSKDRGR